MSTKNIQVIVTELPTDWVKESHFKIIETEMPIPGDGQILVQNNWLSLDPYMRGRMSKSKSYAKGVDVGDVMVGGTAGTVIESKSSLYHVGDQVVTATGWQKYGIANEKEVTKIHSKGIPSSAYVGVLGMPGVTAWMGLMDICQPKAGETVLVDAASGAVGSVVGQLAKAQGCKVVGIAGGPTKCEYVVKELGFDTCVDHKSPTFKDDLKDATPNGVDCLFENVGGMIFDNILARMNPFSRIALCGLVSEYNTEPHGFKNLRSILVNRIKFQGFIVSDRPEAWPQIIQSLESRILEGKLKYKESIVEGLENAPKAFVGLLKGENFGKQLIKIS
jgi:NADPH-dependent curcumin reductase